MASGAVLRPNAPVAENIYTSSATWNWKGSSLTCTKNITDYRFIVIEFFASSRDGGNRGRIVVPVESLQNACYVAVAAADTVGYLRLERQSTATQLKLVNATWATVIPSNIWGYV